MTQAPLDYRSPEWLAFKDWFWNSPWTRKRCFWCRGLFWHLAKALNLVDRIRAHYGVTGWRQINHLTYRHGMTPKWYEVKVMCLICHGVETKLAQLFFGKGYDRRFKNGAHYVITYGVRWLIYLALATPILLLWKEVV